jgi:aerobic carbon-monoxide dehydrogenase medium subunit
MVYERPRTVREAIDLLSRYGEDGAIVAGGTDVLVRLRRGGVKPRCLVDVTKVTGLDRLAAAGVEGLFVGACVTHSRTASDVEVRRGYTALSEASRQVGSEQIRNLATVVGNVCNASPAADTAPPLLVLGARVRVAGPERARECDLADLFAGPGTTSLGPQELVTGLVLPRKLPSSGSAYLKLSPRRQMDLAVVGVAAYVRLNPRTHKCADARLALGAVSATPVRVSEVERALANAEEPSMAMFAQLGEEAAHASVCCPISDLRATEAYRREMVGVLVRRALALAWERAKDLQA